MFWEEDLDSYMMLHGFDDEEITLTYKRNGEKRKFPLKHTVKKIYAGIFLCAYTG